MQAPKNGATSLYRRLVSRLRLRQLSLLVAVEHHRNVSRVAIEFGVSQPAITKALREIEEAFSCSLFERNSRGLTPTEVGRAVLVFARRSLAELDEATRVLATIEAGHRGRLRLGIAYAIPQTLLSLALRELLCGDSKVAVMTREGTTDELVAALLARELDCALARSFDGEAPGLVQQTLYEQEVSLVMSSKSAKRMGRRPLLLSQLCGLDWIMPPANTPIRRSYNAMFVAAGLQPPTPLLETVNRRSIEAVLQMEPNAIAIVATAADLIETGSCSILPCRLSIKPPPVSFLTTTLLEQNPIVRSLQTALIAGAGSPPKIR